MPLLQEQEITIAEAAELLEILTDKGDSVMLWGAPGIGKTDIGRQLGAKKNRPVFEFAAALRESVDLRGIPVPDLVRRVTDWLVPNELPQAKRDGEEGYLYLDEINQAPQQMQALLGGLVLYGTIGDYRLPKGWRVIASGNRVKDRASAQRMPSQVKNRFAHLHVAPDMKAWCNWAVANDVAPELIAFLRFKPQFIHVMPKGDEDAYPTPRSWTKCSKYVDAALKHRQRLFAAHVGDAYAAEFNGFIELYNSIGSLENILVDPHTAPVPNEPSQKFAVATGLAQLATRKNFSKIVVYAERLDDERGTLLIHDATLRDPKLKETAGYTKWALNHQAYTLQ